MPEAIQTIIQRQYTTKPALKKGKVSEDSKGVFLHFYKMFKLIFLPWRRDYGIVTIVSAHMCERTTKMV